MNRRKLILVIVPLALLFRKPAPLDLSKDEEPFDADFWPLDIVNSID